MVVVGPHSHRGKLVFAHDIKQQFDRKPNIMSF
jgi:hypothetical protein